MMKQQLVSNGKRHPGFTLVELLVVIAIIGILMGLAIPAINNALRRGIQTSQKMEINSLAQAVDQYFQDYGDYPPDGSNQAVLVRHMRKLFPRMAEPDLTLFNLLVDGSDDPINVSVALPFSPIAMDRAEALVFFLGGFSKNVQLPLTGPGGPLDYIGPASPTLAQQQNLSNYQYNATRDNAKFPFDTARLTIARATDVAPLISTDEAFHYTAGAVFTAAGGADLLPTYRAVDDGTAPIVYFDSRTYGVVTASGGFPVYNGYLSRTAGGVRPYKTEDVVQPPVGATYADEAEAFAAIKFHKNDSYQIISPGSDGLFGRIVSTSTTFSDTNATVQTIHFVTESGRPVRPVLVGSPLGLIYTDPVLGSRGYQDRDWSFNYFGAGTDGLEVAINGHLDNITNFSNSTLEADLSDE